MPDDPQKLDLDWLRSTTVAGLTVNETAAVMRVDHRTVRRACADGQLPSVRVGKRVIIPRLPLLAILEGHPYGGAA